MNTDMANDPSTGIKDTDDFPADEFIARRERIYDAIGHEGDVLWMLDRGRLARSGPRGLRT